MSETIYDLIQKEIEAIDQNNDLGEHRKPLSKIEFKILKELNNQDVPRLYSRLGYDLGEFPQYFSIQVKEAINMSDHDFNQGVKKLYLKRYIDYSFNPEVKFLEMMEAEPSLTKELLKRGTKLNEGLGSSDTLLLTGRGLMAMIDFSLKEMTELKESFKLSIDKQEKQIEELRRLSDIVKGDLATTNANVGEMDHKVSKFNENIFTIFSLMIAAFAVIGINISSIPNIKGDFLINILAINLSVSFSLIVLFILLKILIQKEKKSGLGWLLFGFGLLLLAFTYLVLW